MFLVCSLGVGEEVSSAGGGGPSTCSPIMRACSRRPLPGFTVLLAFAVARGLFPSRRNRTTCGSFGRHSHRWRHVGAHGHGNPKNEKITCLRRHAWRPSARL